MHVCFLFSLFLYYIPSSISFFGGGGFLSSLIFPPLSLTCHQPNHNVHPQYPLFSLSLLSTALPIPSTCRDTEITASQIATIAPKSQSCVNAPVPKGGTPECANSQEAALNIAKSFETYNMTSRAEQAAVVALMTFESEEFRFSRNQVRG